MSWETATDKISVTRALLVELMVGSGAVRVHDGVGPLDWNGSEWLGTGDLGAISGLSGGGDLDAAETTLMLSGVPTDYREEVLQEVTRGRRVNFYQGVLNTATGGWDFEPELICVGFCDAPMIEEDVSEGSDAFLTITVPVISAASYARRVRVWRRTDSDQQELYAGDKFLAFKTDMRVPVATAAKRQPAIPVRINGGLFAVSALLKQ